MQVKNDGRCWNHRVGNPAQSIKHLIGAPNGRALDWMDCMLYENRLTQQPRLYTKRNLGG